MSETTISATTFSEATLARFAREVAKYPAEQRQSAVMACLAIVQQEQGHISSESEQAVANYLGMDAITVHEVTTFYNMYNQNPVGKFKLSVCTNLSCRLGGAEHALQVLEEKIGAKIGGTSDDGLFTLERCECVGACADAPVLLVNDRHMCSHMTDERLHALVDELKATQEQQT